RDFSWRAIGQRDLTWNGGSQIVKDHFLWGIGPLNWAEEMERKVHFPFDSPHNAALEYVGAYGLPGALLYGALLVVFLRNAQKLRRLGARGPVAQVDAWLFGAILSFLLVELVDVGISLAITLHTIWFWVLMALHTGRAALADRAGVAEGESG